MHYHKKALEIEQKKYKHDKVPISWKRLETSQNPQNFSLSRHFRAGCSTYIFLLL